jgi:hypothetical protein
MPRKKKTRKTKTIKQADLLQAALAEAMKEYLLAVYEIHRARHEAFRDHIKSGIEKQARAILRHCIIDPVMEHIIRDAAQQGKV